MGHNFPNISPLLHLDLTHFVQQISLLLIKKQIWDIDPSLGCLLKYKIVRASRKSWIPSPQEEKDPC
jgi:hypothetical protein